MYLSKKEEKMYAGEYGEPIRKAMEILVAIGDTYDAEHFIKIKKAHIAGLSYKTHGDAGLEYIKILNKENASVCIPTTLNVIGVDRFRWKKLGLPEDWARKQLQILKAYENMGCIGSCSCTPYYHGVLPTFGEHIAWAESSAVVFSNSIIGARDNREGGPSALSTALTGRTPFYGYHLEENRFGHYLINVDEKLEDVHDFGALGVYLGRLIGDKIPVFQGLEKSASLGSLVALGAGLASSGSIAMYHAVGLTPEAKTLEKAFGGKKPMETIDIGKKEMKNACQSLTSASDGDVEFVALGCPHCSLQQIKQIATLLSGKEVHKDVKLWVYTSIPIRALAEKLGYVGLIEKAGGTVTSDMCTVLGCPEKLKFKTMATNSGKMAFYAPASNKLDVWYGSTEECIDAAVKGRWEA